MGVCELWVGVGWEGDKDVVCVCEGGGGATVFVRGSLTPSRAS